MDENGENKNYFHLLPQESKPRERLQAEGVKRLRDEELLAILLRTGYKGTDVMTLAARLLQTYGGLRGLVGLEYQQLYQEKGLGKAKAAELAALLEIALRIAAPQDQLILTCPDEVAAFLMPLLRQENQEKFLVLSLNSKNQLIHQDVVFIGTLNSTVVHPREVFKSALQHAAAGIIVAHNHPSGDPTPSAEDMKVTQNLVEAGKVMGIPLLDHLVIGHGKWLSLRDCKNF
ncbi:MAG: DNA repair protein RadC [Negativicutes bacterium]|nr:DNA repair protein RadC [Negativicutes bacterium]